VQCIEAERLKQKAQIQRMCQENAWLRDELASTQRRLQVSEQRCAMLDEEKSHLQFLSDLKTHDAESAETEEVRCRSTAYAYCFINIHCVWKKSGPLQLLSITTLNLNQL